MRKREIRLLKNGDRLEMSISGIRQGFDGRDHVRKAQFVRHTRDPFLIIIKRDGRKTAERFHYCFWNRGDKQ